MEFFPTHPPGQKKVPGEHIKTIFFFFLKRVWADTAFVRCIAAYFLIALLGVCPLPVSCAYLNESMDPHWRPKLLGLLQNWRRMIMQPHPRVLDQISQHQEVTCLMGKSFIGPPR